MSPRCCRRRLDVSVCDTTRERCRIRFDLKCHDISEENMPLAKCRYALNAFPSFLVAKMRIHTVVKCFSLFSVTFLLFLFLSRWLVPSKSFNAKRCAHDKRINKKFSIFYGINFINNQCITRVINFYWVDFHTQNGNSKMLFMNPLNWCF